MKKTIFVFIILACLYFTIFAQTRYNPSTQLENIEKFDEIQSFLPDGNTYIDELGFSIRHPEGWVMSSFHIQETSLLRDFSEWNKPPDYDSNVNLFVFAPEPVDLEMLYNNASHRDFPMLVVQPTIYVRNDGITYDVDIDFGAVKNTRLNLPEVSTPYGHIQGNPSYRSVRLHVLASEQDWRQHQEMYEAMIGFPQTFQYATHSELRHMFLWWDFYFGYPENWEYEIRDESFENYSVNIMFTTSNTSIEVVIQRGSLGKASPFEQVDGNESRIQAFFSKNNIVQEEQSKLIQAYNDSGCDVISPPLYLVSDNRHGFVRLYRGIQIRISVEKAISINDLPLEEIAGSFFQLSLNSCG